MRYVTRVHDERGNEWQAVILYSVAPFSVDDVVCGWHMPETELARITAECRKYSKLQTDD